MLAVITAIDNGMVGFLAPLARIILWAVFSGCFSMALYKYLSPQQKLEALKNEQSMARQALMRYDGEFNGMLAIIKKDLGLSCRQIAIIFLPFALSVAPLVALISCLFTLYGEQPYTSFGPDWMRGFAFWYFSALLVVSLFIKIRFKII